MIQAARPEAGTPTVSKIEPGRSGSSNAHPEEASGVSCTGWTVRPAQRRDVQSIASYQKVDQWNLL